MLRTVAAAWKPRYWPKRQSPGVNWLSENPAEFQCLVYRIHRQRCKCTGGHTAYQCQWQAFRREVAGQYHWHVGNQHTEGCANDHQNKVRVLRGQHHRGDLGFVAHFREEEGNQGGQEWPVALEL